MTSKLVVNTIEADTGISSVSFASSISMSSTSKFHFGDAGIDIGADTNINRPASGVLAFNINSSEKVRINSSGQIGIGTDNPHSSYRFDIRHSADNILHLGQGAATLAGMANNSWNAISFQGTNCEFGLYKDGSGDFSYIMGTYQGSTAIPLIFRTGNREERLRITSTGKLLIGHSSSTSVGVGAAYNMPLQVIGNSYDTAGIVAARYAADANGPTMHFVKSRNATKGSQTIVQVDDTLGFIRWYGSDGTDTTNAAAMIGGYCDATPASDKIPGRLSFWTTDTLTYPRERLRITSDGRVLINTTAVTNTNDVLTVKRAAGSWTEMSMTVDANTATGNYANAFVFTKSKNTYWNGLGFQSSHGHIGAIVGMRNSTAMDTSQKIRIELGGTGINASEEKTWDFLNTGDLSISDGNLVVASGHGINFSATANAPFGNASNRQELLDDYEEGQWLPVYSGNTGGGSVTYSYRKGYYIKVGAQVTVWIEMTIATSSGMSGVAQISNLPFNKNDLGGAGNDQGGGTQTYYYSGTTNWYIQYHAQNKPIFTGWMPNNSNLIRIYNANHWGNVTNAPINTNGRMSFSYTYTTSA